MKLVQLFCIICSLFLFTNITLAKDADEYHVEIPIEYFKDGISVHMCPIEKWDTYYTMTGRGDHGLATIYHDLQDNGQKHTLYITWPTEEKLEVACLQNKMVILTNPNTNVVIITNYLTLEESDEQKNSSK